MMKKQLLLILSLSFFLHPLWAAEFKTQAEAEKKLASYGVADLAGDEKKAKEGKERKIDEMFDDLETTAKLVGKSTLSEDLAYEMIRVSLLTFTKDSSGYAIEAIVEVYKNNTVLFDKAAQRFHPYDRDLFLKVIKARVRVETEGQG